MQHLASGHLLFGRMSPLGDCIAAETVHGLSPVRRSPLLAALTSFVVAVVTTILECSISISVMSPQYPTFLA